MLEKWRSYLNDGVYIFNWNWNWNWNFICCIGNGGDV